MKFRHSTETRPLLASIHNETLGPIVNGQKQTVETVELSLMEAQVLSAELDVQQLPSSLTLPYKLTEDGETLNATVKIKVMMPDEMHIDDYLQEQADGEDSVTA